MKIIQIITLLSAGILLSGCTSPKKYADIQTIYRDKKSGVSGRSKMLEYQHNRSQGTETNTWHAVRSIPRPDRTNITLCTKLNPVWWFGNIDQPLPPESYHQNEKTRIVKWYIRNPWSNLTSYTIGVEDKEFIRCGYYPELNWNPHDGWSYAVIKYKWLRLPYVSYSKKQFSCYLGWRHPGNFGIKINWIKKKDFLENPGKRHFYK